MNAHASTATWTEHSLPGSYSVRIAPNAAFGVVQEGPTYYVTIPGHGLRKCWNRAEVERVCLDYWEQFLACPDDDEDEDEDDACHARGWQRHVESFRVPA